MMQHDSGLFFVALILLLEVILSLGCLLLLIKDIPFLKNKKNEPTLIEEVLQLKLKVMESQLSSLTEERDKLQLELVTARRQVEEFRQAKISFVANGAHELRTPLNAILGLAEILQHPLVEETRRKEFSQLIYKRGHDLLHAINNIIELSKIDSGQFILIHAKVELTHLFDEIISAQALVLNMTDSKFNIDFKNEVNFSSGPILADVVRLRHVLGCLLRNAIQHTQSGTIRLGCKDQPEKQCLLFYVSDTGKGITRHYREKIFTRFEKIPDPLTDEHGSGIGLGLAVCKAIVTSWGGEIWVESIIERGSVFYFTIPY